MTIMTASDNQHVGNRNHKLPSSKGAARRNLTSKTSFKSSSSPLTRSESVPLQEARRCWHRPLSTRVEHCKARRVCASLLASACDTLACSVCCFCSPCAGLPVSRGLCLCLCVRLDWSELGAVPARFVEHRYVFHRCLFHFLTRSVQCICGDGLALVEFSGDLFSTDTTSLGCLGRWCDGGTTLTLMSVLCAVNAASTMAGKCFPSMGEALGMASGAAWV